MAPPIPATSGAIIFALVTIAFGIFFEKYYVGRNSMIFNSIDVLVLGMTIELSQTALAALVVYAIIGWVLTRVKGYQWVKQAFGSKAYGALSLSLALNNVNQLWWASNLLNWLISGQSSFEFFADKLVVFAWLVLLIPVTILQLIVLRKNLQLRL